MKKFKWYFYLSILLIITASALYYSQIKIFNNPHDTFFYLLQDLAFVPIQVLLVTLILNEFLSRREKHILLSKMNMVIGAFFSEVGTELLKYFADIDCNIEEIKKVFQKHLRWDEKDFKEVNNFFSTYNYNLDNNPRSLSHLKEFLLSKKDFLLRLLENPNLLEHDRFTELLWAVFHLTEELTKRKNVENFIPTDYAHLLGDIKRAYSLLVMEWLYYLKHLKQDYPYIFSLTMRANPFDDCSSVEINQ